MAAKLGDVHPSPATWVRFAKSRTGEIKISNIGQFMTGFRSDDNHCYTMLRAEFRTTYVHPYFGRLCWEYTPSDLGLRPVESLRWYQQYHGEPPTDGYVSHRYLRAVVRDPRDACTIWEPHFIVKLPRAHKVLGCTPEEFRRIHLAKFYKVIQNEADDLFYIGVEDNKLV